MAARPRPQLRLRHAAPRPAFALARLLIDEARARPRAARSALAVLVSGGLASSALAIVSSRLERVGELVVTATSSEAASAPPAAAMVARSTPSVTTTTAEAPPSTTAGPATSTPTTGAPSTTTTAAPATSTSARPTTTVARATDEAGSASRRLTPSKTIVSADISPKSVISTGHGLFFAQNMMYRHSMTVYDAQARLVATIPDDVRLADFGFAEHQGTVTGSPVEATATADGRYVYVSNYQMDGPGFTNPGNDECGPGDWDPSFVYRVDTRTMAIDRVIEVGSVPKFLALTNDERHLLVSNWCSYDLSVVDLATGKEARRVPLGPYPRGIAVDPARKVAYVAVMGSTSIAVVNLADWSVSWLRDVGLSPRHLVVGPDGRDLYATLNGEGEVVRIDLARKTVAARVRTGDAPRSMAIAPDGGSLYVVNYGSASVSKVRTSDMAVVQTVPVRPGPIGIAYDAPTRTVWVAIYSGAIIVLDDAAPS